MGMWRNPKEVAITEVGRNRVLISFNDHEKGSQMLNRGLWTVDANVWSASVSHVQKHNNAYWEELCSSSTVSLCARFSLLCRRFGLSSPSLSPLSLRRESNEHCPISRRRRTRCHAPPEVDCLPHQSCSCRHLSASFCPPSRRIASSSPLLLSSSQLQESNEPRFVPRSHSTHPHAPPEGPCSTLFDFSPEVSVAVRFVARSTLQTAPHHRSFPFPPDGSATIGSAYTVHGPDRATCSPLIRLHDPD
ncbi:hypothetical protein PIB30_077339 [Stylosanthes scabra]|uniref:DUF4283 domain-containing protein n=1 Tax=Stylosanthes scabra TaxID=79078 RepID=A0ABU6YRB6_9FABA|nr:hypothetical protein [Stylosanthes scabra]